MYMSEGATVVQLDIFVVRNNGNKALALVHFDSIVNRYQMQCFFT